MYALSPIDVCRRTRRLFRLPARGAGAGSGLFPGADAGQKSGQDSYAPVAALTSSHLHMALSTSRGEVFGGHVAPGCIVRTTAEVLLALLPEWEFAREHYALTE